MVSVFLNGLYYLAVYSVTSFNTCELVKLITGNPLFLESYFVGGGIWYDTSKFKLKDALHCLVSPLEDRCLRLWAVSGQNT